MCIFLWSDRWIMAVHTEQKSQGELKVENWVMVSKDVNV